MTEELTNSLRHSKSRGIEEISTSFNSGDTRTNILSTCITVDRTGFEVVGFTNVKVDLNVQYTKTLRRCSIFRYGVLEDPRDRSDWVHVGDEGFEFLLRHADHQIRHCSGGTILSDLLESQDAAVRKSAISGLVRGEANVKVLSEKGINAEIFSDLDASDEIEKVATGYDGMLSAPPLRLGTFGQ